MNVRRWTRGRCRKAVAEDDEEDEEDVARDARRVSREGRPMRAPLRSASARGRDMAESCWRGFREEGGEGRKQGREGHHYAGVTWVLRSCYSPPAPAWQLAPSRGDLSSSKPTYLPTLPPPLWASNVVPSSSLRRRKVHGKRQRSRRQRRQLEPRTAHKDGRQSLAFLSLSLSHLSLLLSPRLRLLDLLLSAASLWRLSPIGYLQAQRRGELSISQAGRVGRTRELTPLPPAPLLRVPLSPSSSASPHQQQVDPEEDDDDEEEEDEDEDEEDDDEGQGRNRVR